MVIEMHDKIRRDWSKLYGYSRPQIGGSDIRACNFIIILYTEHCTIYLSLVLLSFLCFLEQQCVLLCFLQPQVGGEPHQKLEAVYVLWEPLMDGLVALESLLVVSCGEVGTEGDGRERDGREGDGREGERWEGGR